jgi:hypothetical protein
MSQLPILEPMDKSSAPMGWCSTLSKKRLHDAANTKGGKWTKELPNALCVGAEYGPDTNQ